jgi:hypothetical protein
VETIHVLLAEVKGVLGDIVRRALEKEADIEIIAEVSGRASLGLALMSRQGDVVIWGAGPISGESVDSLIQDQIPRVLSIEDDGRRTSEWSIHHQQVSLGQLSADALVDALHRIASEDRHGNVGDLLRRSQPTGTARDGSDDDV